MTQLNWTRDKATGIYTATEAGQHQIYAIEPKGSRFVLRVNGNEHTFKPTTLKQCKEWAQQEEDTEERTKKFAEVVVQSANSIMPTQEVAPTELDQVYETRWQEVHGLEETNDNNCRLMEAEAREREFQEQLDSPIIGPLEDDDDEEEDFDGVDPDCPKASGVVAPIGPDPFAKLSEEVASLPGIMVALGFLFVGIAFSLIWG